MLSQERIPSTGVRVYTREGDGRLIKLYKKVTFALDVEGLGRENSKKNEMLASNHGDVKGYLVRLN